MPLEEYDKIGKAMREAFERNMAFSNKFAEVIQKSTLKNYSQFEKMADTINKATVAFAQNPIFQDMAKQSAAINSGLQAFHETIKPSAEIYKKLSQMDMGQFTHLSKQYSEFTKNISSLALYRSSVNQQLLDNLERAYQSKLKDVSEMGDKKALKKLTDTVKEANEIAKQIKENESDIFIKVTKFISKIITGKHFKDLSSDLFKSLIVQVIIMICFQTDTNQTINIKNETITINNNFDKETSDIDDLRTLVSNRNINLRSRKDFKSRIILIIPVDTEVKVLREYHKWILIALTTAEGEYVIGYSYKEYFK